MSDSSPAGRPSSRERFASAGVWTTLFAPGLVCVGLALFVVDSTLLLVAGIVLLLAPLVVQMFGPDWDREHIPEGHHHDHPPGEPPSSV